MTFPAHTPSTRGIRYGDWNTKRFAGGNSLQARIIPLPSSAKKSDVFLELTYANRDDAVARDFMRHYLDQRGGFNDFKLPKESLLEGPMAGWKVPNGERYISEGHWSYGKAPQITSKHPGTSTTTLTLICGAPSISDEVAEYHQALLDEACGDGPIEFKSTVKVNIFLDDSGSMNNVLLELLTMRDTVLKDCLLPFYNNDEDLYNQNVKALSMARTSGTEATFVAARYDITSGDDPGEPTTNQINIVFQDEARPRYHTYHCTFSANDNLTPDFKKDMENLQGYYNRYQDPKKSPHAKVVYGPDFMRAHIFQVTGTGCTAANYKILLKATENGEGNYVGDYSTLNWSDNIKYSYDIRWVQSSVDPYYYANLIIDAINNLGYNVPKCGG